MEKVTVCYEIDREAAILAGKTEFGQIKHEIDPSILTLEQRQELARTKNGERLDGMIDGRFSSDDPQRPLFGEDSPEIPLHLLNWRIAVRAHRAEKERIETERRQASIDAAVSAVLANPSVLICEGGCATEKVGQSSHYWYSTQLRPGYEGFRVIDDPRLSETVANLEKQIEVENEKRKADALAKAQQEETARVQAETEAEAQEQRKKTQIAGWVEAHGTDSQKKRLLAGLLPEAEVIDGIRAEAYASLNSFAKYEKMQDSDFCECEFEGNITYSTEDATEATQEEFAMMEAIQSALPAARVTLRVHNGTCDDCGQSLERKSILVDLTVGEFEFSCEYGVTPTYALPAANHNEKTSQCPYADSGVHNQGYPSIFAPIKWPLRARQKSN